MKLWACLAALTLPLPSPALSQEEFTETFWSSDLWRVVRTEDSCFVSTEHGFEDSSRMVKTLIWIQANEPNPTLMLADTRWRSIETGEIYSVQLDLGRPGAWTTWTLNAIGGEITQFEEYSGSLLFRLDYDSFVQTYADSQYLQVRRDGIPILGIDLTGSSAAMDALDRCLAVVRAAPNFDPFAEDQ